MSVYSLTFPGHPVSIADELESFFHVLLYLAVRFLRTNLSNAGAFIESYFDAFELDGDNMAFCGFLKDKIVQTGSLVWITKPIRFFSEAPQSDRSLQQQDGSHSTRLSPLNDTIAKLLAYFKARYAILDYQRKVSAKISRPMPSLQSATEAATPSAAAEAAAAAEARTKELRRAYLKAKGVGRGRSTKRDVNPEPSTPSLPVLEKPSQAVYDMAAKLASHDAILDLFASEIYGRIWPKDDYAGDQLDRYVPCQLQSTAKRIRLQT